MQFLTRALWFVFVGWWLAAIWGFVAWLCCVSLVLLPIGTTMFNNLPRVLTLKPAERDPYTGRPARELSWLLRAVWFVFVGWWLGLVFFKLGYLLCLSIIGMPAGVWMLHRVPLAMTLKQSA